MMAESEKEHVWIKINLRMHVLAFLTDHFLRWILKDTNKLKFQYFVSPFKEGMVCHFDKLSTLYLRMFCLVKIGQVVLEKKSILWKVNRHINFIYCEFLKEYKKIKKNYSYWSNCYQYEQCTFKRIAVDLFKQSY